MLHNQTPSKEGTPDDVHKVEYSEVNTSTEITQGWYMCYSVAIILLTMVRGKIPSPGSIVVGRNSIQVLIIGANYINLFRLM